MRSLHSRMLRYLDEVARCGSIRKAAGRLNVAASSINRQILALEAEIGVPLFDRLPTRLRMTSAGEMVIAHVRRTLADLERTQSYVEDLRGSRRGEVVVAMMGGLGSDLMARAAISYRERRPWVKLVFHRMSRADILLAVREGRANLGLSFGMKGQLGLRSLLAMDCPIGAVMSPRHALAQRKSLRLTELLSERLILPAETMTLRLELDELLTRSGLTANPIVEANEVELMKRLAVLNQGIALLNRPNIEPERQRGDLVFVPLSDSGLPVPVLQLFELDRGSTPVLSALFAEMFGQLVDEVYSDGDAG